MPSFARYTLIILSVKAANNVFPVTFHANAVHANLSPTFLFFPSFFGFSTKISENGKSESVFKLKILTPVSVAAATHYMLGLKATLFTELPVLNSLNSSDRSFKSQTFTVFSFPPVAM